MSSFGYDCGGVEVPGLAMGSTTVRSLRCFCSRFVTHAQTSNFPLWRDWSVIRGNEAETSTSSRSTAKRLDIAGARRAQTLGQQVRHAERHFQNTSLWPADFASPYQFGEPFRVATFTCGRQRVGRRRLALPACAGPRLFDY